MLETGKRENDVADYFGRSVEALARLVTAAHAICALVERDLGSAPRAGRCCS